MFTLVQLILIKLHLIVNEMNFIKNFYIKKHKFFKITKNYCGLKKIIIFVLLYFKIIFCNFHALKMYQKI